ncbi:MAG: CoA transferase [Dehalococcoidales bacterium]|nr:CoA transferase [Dehalococcoidales bacterium]
MKKIEKARALDGIRVTEFTTSWVGPESGLILSQMGADIVRIENPAMPDYWRRVSPAYFRGEGLDKSGYFAILNRGKKSCVLDLKKPENVEIAKRLVKISDIVIANFAPRVMDNLGLGYAALKEVKPDIIMIAASGYGATGPDRAGVAFGPALEPYSGVSILFGNPGGPPLPSGVTITDHHGALSTALAALVALHHREQTGEGQYVDIAEVETMLTIMPEAIMSYTMNRYVPPPDGNHDEVMAPHRCYRCQGDDKWVAIAVANDEEFRALCKVMGQLSLSNDERFNDGFRRYKNQNELDEIINNWTLTQDANDVMTRLQKAGVASAPAYSAEELFRNPQLLARDFFVEHEHPLVGKKVLPGVFAKFSETPAEIRGSDPLFGEHTEWVVTKLLGMTRP